VTKAEAREEAGLVTKLLNQGSWLLIHEKEVFLPFEKFPWFRDAPIGKVLHVESVLHPERYPLVSGMHEAGEGYGADEDRQKALGCKPEK